MTSVQAVGYNDPYFLQAYNSPNALQMQQAQQAQQALQTQGVGAENPFGVNNPTGQNITPRAAETKKKNNTAAWCVLGAATLAGTAWMISRGKTAGAEGLWNQFVAGIKSFGKNSSGALTLGVKNGQKICSLPGKSNVMRNPNTIVDDLAAIGLKDGDKFALSNITKTLDDGTKALADGIKIREGSFKIGENLVTFKNGNVIKYVDKNGKDIMSRYIDPECVKKYASKNKADKKVIDDLIASFKKGENLDRVNNLKVLHSNDGITRVFVRENPTDNFNLEVALSKKFNINNDIVKSYRVDNPSAHEHLLKFEKGEAVGNILSAEYNSKIGTLLIKNNEIVGIKDTAGKIHAKGSTKYNALFYDNHTIFEEALKQEDKFTNIIRVVA